MHADVSVQTHVLVHTRTHKHKHGHLHRQRTDHNTQTRTRVVNALLRSNRYTCSCMTPFMPARTTDMCAQATLSSARARMHIHTCKCMLHIHSRRPACLDMHAKEVRSNPIVQNGSDGACSNAIWSNQRDSDQRSSAHRSRISKYCFRGPVANKEGGTRK